MLHKSTSSHSLQSCWSFNLISSYLQKSLNQS